MSVQKPHPSLLVFVLTDASEVVLQGDIVIVLRGVCEVVIERYVVTVLSDVTEVLMG